MALPLNSQITLKPKEVKAFINETGDTLIAFRLDDAKLILTDILTYQITDSLLKVYELKDKRNGEIIILQKEVINTLNKKIENQDERIKILETIIVNKDKEIELLNDIVKQQKKEIRKQKFLKIVGFSGSAALLATTLLLITTN
jgi:hypothetical protein